MGAAFTGRVYMKILFLGDVVAKSGREAVIRNIKPLKSEYGADFVIVNGENAAHGKGITATIYSRLVGAGADIVTVLAMAADETISDVIDTAHNAGRKVMADLIGIVDIQLKLILVRICH